MQMHAWHESHRIAAAQQAGGAAPFLQQSAGAGMTTAVTVVLLNGVLAVQR